MKKIGIIVGVVGLIVVIGIVLLLSLGNKVESTIIMDINPSIEISVDKDRKVIDIKALNDDAKKIVSKNMNGKELDNVVNQVIERVKTLGYYNEIDRRVDILLYTKGSIDREQLMNNIRGGFGDINTEIEVIDKISKEDEEIAKKYNISVAKAAYINSISTEEEKIDYFKDKSFSEIKESKETGNYCDDGYKLEGDRCIKVLGEEKAEYGEVCKNGYFEYNGKCYDETPPVETDKLFCNEEFTLKENKCCRKIEFKASPSKYSCSKGKAMTRVEAGLSDGTTGDANDIVCVDLSNATHPVSPCEANDGTEYTRANGKCYWHRAGLLPNGCPGKIRVNGECWDDATGIYICPGYRDGKQYKSTSEYCEHSIKYYDPVVTEYKCPDDHKLEGDMCIKEEIEDANREKACPDGYTEINKDRCLDMSTEEEKEKGYYCEKENSRLEENKCILFEEVPAKRF